MLAVVGLLGGILAFVANIPYITDTLKGRTKPHRVTWGIFLVLNVIFLANQSSVGAINSIWLVIGFILSTLTIFILSLKYGVGGYNKQDMVLLLGALLGVVLWVTTKSPSLSIFSNLLSATFAYIPTFNKAWKNPITETKIKWLLGSIAALLSAISVGKFEIIILLLPIYSFVTQGLIYLILNRHRDLQDSLIR